MLGEWDVRRPTGIAVAGLVVTHRPVVSRNLVQRLGAARPELPTVDVGLEHPLPGGVLTREATGHLERGVEPLLLPTSHRDAPPVPLERTIRVAGVEEALREVEDGTRVVRVGVVRGSEQLGVARVSVARSAPVAQPSRLDVVVAEEALLADRSVTRGVLVHEAFEAPRSRHRKDLVAPVREVGAIAQGIAVGAQLAEIEIAGDTVICVEDPRVVGLSGTQLERLGAIVREGDPGSFVQLAGDPVRREPVADHVLGAVGRPGVDDHPAVDVRSG